MAVGIGILWHPFRSLLIRSIRESCPHPSLSNLHPHIHSLTHTLAVLQLPTIIEALGYTANQAQLWSVIPYAVASLLTVCVAFASDRFQLRGVLMLCTLPVAIVGYAGIAFVTDPRVKYGMTMLMATGMYCSVPPVLSWLSNNSAGHYKRATTSALQLAIANCGGFVAVSCLLVHLFA